MRSLRTAAAARAPIRERVPMRRVTVRALGVPLLGLALLGLSGCAWFDGAQTRGQAEDPERDKDLGVLTVGEVTFVGNALPIQVTGIGLVTGLDGTGGAMPPNNPYRKKLEEDMLKRRIENVRGLLDSSDNALVLVTALIPPGCRKGDPL